MTIKKALETNKKGFHIGHRLILPFKCNILKIIVDGEIYTEMVGSKNIKLSQDMLNTSIYLRDVGRLSNFFGTYKVIKIIVCELDADLTVVDNHYKLICEVGESRTVDIHVPTDDMLFIE